jgi:pseudouridine kinase
MKNNYVVVIGAANIDVQGLSESKLVLEDSNPGKIVISSGGVGRNIAENMSRLGVATKLITVIGSDPYSKNMVEECKNCDIDMTHSLVIDGMSSPMYLSILDNNGDMKLALCDNQILECMTQEFIKSKNQIIENAAIILLDTNLPQEILKYIADTYKHKLLFIDTVSTKKALKIKDFIGSFNTLKLNRLEAEALSGIKIADYKDLPKLTAYFTEKGVENTFITLGEDGVFYGKNANTKLQPTPKVTVINATGAGDAFMAALVYARLHDYDLDTTSKFAIGASILALHHENTINPDMSLQNINNLLKELELC